MDKRFFLMFFLFSFLVRLGHSQPSYDQKVLEVMIDFNQQMKSDRLVVSINDTTIADITYRGKPKDRFAIYSITKLFSGIAIGILIDNKLIENPEIPIASFYEEWKGDSSKNKITIRHILQHTSGLFANNGSGDIYPQPDFVKFALNSSITSKPGHKYFYNNKAINIISGIVRKVTGMTLEQFIKENVFTPLDIQDYKWMHDNAGNTWAMDGLWLNATDLLKVGQMLNNYGEWRGKQILSKKWCEIMFQLPLLNSMNGVGGYGMCIRPLFFDEQIILASETISKLTDLGLDNKLVEKLSSLHKREYYKYFELGSALKQTFTADEMEELSAFASKYMIPLYKIHNENFVIMHGGEYGLIVTAFPKKNIVVVRYLGEKWGRKKKEDGSDNKYLIDGEIISYMIKLKRD
jgi:CubicO group peptidase (beta-lactamase class C family)